MKDLVITAIMVNEFQFHAILDALFQTHVLVGEFQDGTFKKSCGILALTIFPVPAFQSGRRQVVIGFLDTFLSG